MIRRSILALLLFSGCAAPPAPRSVLPPPPDPRLQIRILYVLEDGGVFRCDELSSAPEQRNFREIRAESDETFTRYSFTLNPEGPEHWWTSL